MKYFWIATLIATAAGVAGIACGVWSYYMPTRGDPYSQIGYLVAGIVLLILAALAAALAGLLYLFANIH